MNNNVTATNKKQEGKKMIIAGNTTAKEILTNAGKNTFRFIRDVFGIDFTRPVILCKHIGGFTIKKIWDEIPHNNYDYNVAVILNESYRGLRIAEILPYGFDIELKPLTYFSNWHTHPDTFFCKGDFEKARKTTDRYYVIAQKKEYQIDRRIRTYNFYRPEIVENNRYIHVSDKYGRIQLKDINGKGMIFDYEIVRGLKVSDYFDKSGYYVKDKRENLHRKAKALRDERAKALYLETDTSSKATNARIAVTKAKTYIIGLLAAANNYETVSKIANILDFDFKWIVFDLELFEKRTANKEYSSIESSEKAYNNIMQKIEKLYNKLAEKEQEETA